MKSTAQLQEIRDRLRVEIGFSCAVSDDDTKITVRFSDNGVEAAHKVVTAFMEEISKRNLGHVKVIQLGSALPVEGEPVVEISRAGKIKDTFASVCPDKAREIIAKIDNK